MSWQVAQAEPIVMSLKKEASDPATKNEAALGAASEARKQSAHSPCPHTPNRRRPHRRLPVRRMKRSVSTPPVRQASAPTSSGPPLYSQPTRLLGSTPYCSSRKLK